jgi:P-type conjugative transfer protein TrbJ
MPAKRLSHACLILMVILMFAVNIPRTVAVLGVGDTVFDATNYALNQQSYLDQVKNTIYVYNQLKNQLTELAYTAENMKALDNKLSLSNITAMQQAVSKFVNFFTQTQGIALNYEQAQAAWDSTYPDFRKYNGLSGADYATRSAIIRDQTNHALYDAMKAQGLIAQVADDRTVLNKLLSASASATGTLAAIQVSNQLAGLQIEQLMRMQVIMSASYRAQASYYAEQVQGNAAAAGNAGSRMTIRSKNPLSGNGSGQGIVEF